LIAFDNEGRERYEGERLRSELARDELSAEPITDVFVFSHGWQGDVPGARVQYNDWVRTMAACTADIEQVRAARGGTFHPLLIGVHWPSLAFGDESIGEYGSFAAALGGATCGDGIRSGDPVAFVDAMVESYAARIADTEAARDALRLIFTRAIDDIAPDRLPQEVADACALLDRESGVAAKGAGAEPGADREPFDPEAVYAAIQDEEAVSFGSFALGGILALPRTLSFWKMKARANQFGEGGGHELLTALFKSAQERVHFHVMGHSFGCIVASSIVAGPDACAPVVRPIDTLTLVQGALSHWSYCHEIPFLRGRTGYFHSIVRDARVRGPIITTQSEKDLAVGRWYPLAAGIRQQLGFSVELPRYGAVGGYGLCGLGDQAQFAPMQPAGNAYDFQAGKIFNLESSAVIARNQGMFVGAHNDFYHPEVAHALWSAVLNSPGPR
jgi:hypothetical protein